MEHVVTINRRAPLAFDRTPLSIALEGMRGPRTPFSPKRIVVPLPDTNPEEEESLVGAFERQGATGPLLCLIYINDIINASKFLHLILFADDTDIFLHHSDLSILQTMSNAEWDKLSEWFKSNRLSLNIKTTNYIIFSPKCKCRQQQINSFTIQIDGKIIERVEHARILGVYMRNYNGINILIKFQLRSKKILVS